MARSEDHLAALLKLPADERARAARVLQDDAFEDAAADWVSRHYGPPLLMERNRAVMPKGPSYYRPDILIRATAARVLLVGDAKRRKRIRAAQIQRVAAYRDAVAADRAIVFIAAHAQIDRAADRDTRALDVTILRQRDPVGWEIDPLLIEASKDVDRSLLQWSLSLTPRQRLQACTRATRALSKFKRVEPPQNR